MLVLFPNFKDYIPILLSLVLLAAFLCYYLISLFHQQQNDLNKEVSYMFANAFKSAESKVFDKMIFEMKGVSWLNSDTTSKRIEIINHRTNAIAFDTSATFDKAKKRVGKFVISSEEKINNISSPLNVKIEIKGDSLNLDTTKTIFSAHLSSNFKEVEKIFTENLRKSGLDINYAVTKDSSRVMKTENEGYKDVFSNQYYFVSAGNNFWYLIKRILPEIFLSVILYLALIFSFGNIIYASRKQKEWYNMKEDFMRNMTHELKTPIATIGVALEAIQNFHAGQDESVRQEYYRLAETENNKLNALVDKVLSISQNMDHTSEGLENVHVPTLVSEIIESFRLRADQNGVKLLLENCNMNNEVMIEAQNLVLALHNLIDNAIKYNKVADPAIVISISETKGRLLISVKDNGKSIETEYETKIFEKFYRIPKGDIHDVKGHGMGLYIVSHLIKSMNGSVRLLVSDNGNNFELNLPFKNSSV